MTDRLRTLKAGHINSTQACCARALSACITKFEVLIKLVLLVSSSLTSGRPAECPAKAESPAAATQKETYKIRVINWSARVPSQ